MAEAAAFSAACSTGRMAAERVITSAMVSVPSRLRLSRCNSPASALVASALRNETCSRSGLAGLTTKSVAPARMTDTTLSMPPWAVCTMTGMSRPASRMRASTPRPSRSGITRSSTTQSIARVRPGEQADRRVAALGDHGLIAEALDHGLEQPALDRIVIDDEHDLRHGTSGIGGCADLEQCRRSGLMGS